MNAQRSSARAACNGCGRVVSFDGIGGLGVYRVARCRERRVAIVRVEGDPGGVPLEAMRFSSMMCASCSIAELMDRLNREVVR